MHAEALYPGAAALKHGQIMHVGGHAFLGRHPDGQWVAFKAEPGKHVKGFGFENAEQAAGVAYNMRGPHQEGQEIVHDYRQKAEFKGGEPNGGGELDAAQDELGALASRVVQDMPDTEGRDHRLKREAEQEKELADVAAARGEDERAAEHFNREQQLRREWAASPARQAGRGVQSVPNYQEGWERAWRAADVGSLEGIRPIIEPRGAGWVRLLDQIINEKRGAAPQARQGAAEQNLPEKIVPLLELHGELTIPEMAVFLNVMQNKLYRVVPQLEREGRIVKDGRNWRLVLPEEQKAAAAAKHKRARWVGQVKRFVDREPEGAVHKLAEGFRVEVGERHKAGLYVEDSRGFGGLQGWFDAEEIPALVDYALGKQGRFLEDKARRAERDKRQAAEDAEAAAADPAHGKPMLKLKPGASHVFMQGDEKGWGYLEVERARDPKVHHAWLMRAVAPDGTERDQAADNLHDALIYVREMEDFARGWQGEGGEGGQRELAVGGAERASAEQHILEAARQHAKRLEGEGVPKEEALEAASRYENEARRVAGLSVRAMAPSFARPELVARVGQEIRDLQPGDSAEIEGARVALLNDPETATAPRYVIERDGERLDAYLPEQARDAVLVMAWEAKHPSRPAKEAEREAERAIERQLADLGPGEERDLGNLHIRREILQTAERIGLAQPGHNYFLRGVGLNRGARGLDQLARLVVRYQRGNDTMRQAVRDIERRLEEAQQGDIIAMGRAPQVEVRSDAKFDLARPGLAPLTLHEAAQMLMQEMGPAEVENHAEKGLALEHGEEPQAETEDATRRAVDKLLTQREGLIDGRGWTAHANEAQLAEGVHVDRMPDGKYAVWVVFPNGETVNKEVEDKEQAIQLVRWMQRVKRGEKQLNEKLPKRLKPGVAEGIAEALRAPGGGFTRDLTTGQPIDHGFAVAMTGAGMSKEWKAEQFFALDPKGVIHGKAYTARWIKDHREQIEALEDEHGYIAVGGWHDPETDMVMLEPTLVIANDLFPPSESGKLFGATGREMAEELGRQWKQKSIFDLANGVEISLKGVEVAADLGPAAAYERPFEEPMRAGEVKDLESIDGGVNTTYEGHVVSGDQNVHVIFKPRGQAAGRMRDNIAPGRDAERERAAYLVAQRLNIPVPATITREVPGKGDGAMMRFIDEAEGVGGPEELESGDVQTIALLDEVIGNMDRHGGNVLLLDGQLIPIDHGLSFPDSAGGDGNEVIVSEAFDRDLRAIDPEQRKILEGFLRRDFVESLKDDAGLGAAEIELFEQRVRKLLEAQELLPWRRLAS